MPPSLDPHPRAALEYWFFKVNAGPVALLVDWIARRQAGQHWLRASIHSPAGRAVLWEPFDGPLPPAPGSLDRERTCGKVGSISWDLAIDPGQDWIEPDLFPSRWLQIPDLLLGSAPLATFTGWIRHAGQEFELQAAPGMMSHYWGRRLPHEWWWVSANQFDRTDVAVECTFLRSGVWGLPVRLPLAYLYLRRGPTRHLITAPPALAWVRGSPEQFEIGFHSPGSASIRLRARGRAYGDLGDGIANTLTGDLEIRVAGRLLARAEGTSGLERRAA